MQAYDPDVQPDRRHWLELDDDARLQLVVEYHARGRVRLSNARLHAAIHVVIENQLALGEGPVIEALARLQRTGMTRHDALHAIGTAISEHLIAVSRAEPADAARLHEAYAERLAALGRGGETDG